MNNEIILSDITKKMDEHFRETTKATEKAFIEILNSAGVMKEYAREHPDEFRVTLQSLFPENGYGYEYKFYRNGLQFGICQTEVILAEEPGMMRAIVSYQTLKPEENNTDD